MLRRISFRTSSAAVKQVVHSNSLLTRRAGYVAASGAALWLCQREAARLNPEFKAAKEMVIRSFRMVGTISLIVHDYEYAKFATKYLPVPESEKEQQQWEEEREKRRKVLEEAQVAYTSPKDALLQNSTKSRMEIVNDQRKAVQSAAESLAEAEEMIAKIGGRKGKIHRKAATRLLQLCRTNGGVYIKVGSFRFYSCEALCY